MSTLEHGEPFSFVKQEVYGMYQSIVSHPFDSVHVLFVALYCVKSQETYRVRRVSSCADLQLRNGVKGHSQGIFYSNQLTSEALACTHAGS